MQQNQCQNIINTDTYCGKTGAKIMHSLQRHIKHCLAKTNKTPFLDKNGVLTSSTIARSNFADPDNVNTTVGVDKDGKRDITIAQGDKPITKYTVCFDIFTIMFFNIPNPKGFIV
jgi:hypothetical protein